MRGENPKVKSKFSNRGLSFIKYGILEKKVVDIEKNGGNLGKLKKGFFFFRIPGKAIASFSSENEMLF